MGDSDNSRRHRCGCPLLQLASIVPLFAESVREDQRGTAFSLLSLTWFLPGFYSHLMAGFLAERYGDRLIVGILLVQAVKGMAIALWDPSSRSYLSKSVPEAES